MKSPPFFIAVVVCVLGSMAALAEDWPTWRGPKRDNLSTETGLLKAWPKGGPKLLWMCKEAGLGFSCPAIVGDVFYTMGADETDEYAMAFSAKDGSKLWMTKLGPIFLDPLTSYGDGPRATPTVDGGNVYCLASHGELACLKQATGVVVWRTNLVKDFGGQVMELNAGTNWGYCESPLIDGEMLICCPGGANGWMLALDKATGKEKWRTKECKDQATDSSIIVTNIGGVRQYVNTSSKDGQEGAVAGVEAETGKVLWYLPVLKGSGIYAICATPVFKDNLVYVTSGYGGGCNLAEVSKDAAGKFSARDLYEKNNRAKKVMKNETGGVVLVDGHVYGYSDGAGWVCQELKTGNELWSDRNELDGKGSLTYADGHLYLLSDQGEVVLLKASTEAWQEKGRFKLPTLSTSRTTRPSHSGIRVWTHPVIANGQLYLRDQELIYCYAVK